MRAADRGLLWNDDDGELKQALDLAGEGLVATADGDCRLEGSAGCRAAVWAFSIGERLRVIKGKGVLLFRDEATAIAAAPLIERAVNANEVMILVTILTEGITVTLTVDIDRDDFDNLAFPISMKQQ